MTFEQALAHLKVGSAIRRPHVFDGRWLILPEPHQRYGHSFLHYAESCYPAHHETLGRDLQLSDILATDWEVMPWTRGCEVPVGSCRRCSECIGQQHHWLQNGVPLSDDCPHGEPMSTDCETCIREAPAFVCKHCDATREMTEDDYA